MQHQHAILFTGFSIFCIASFSSAHSASARPLAVSSGGMGDLRPTLFEYMRTVPAGTGASMTVGVLFLELRASGTTQGHTSATSKKQRGDAATF